MPWITIEGNIYKSIKKASESDIWIPASPSEYHFWNGNDWELDLEKQQNGIIKNLTKALEDHYDAIAQKKRYDNRLTCALRAGYAGPFQSEGQTFAIWMDDCNAYGYQVMQDCLDQKRTIPTTSELISELPLAPW